MQKIVDEDYYDFIIDNTLLDTYRENDNITPINARHSLAHIRKESDDPCIIGTYPYNFFPNIYTLTSNINYEKSGIEQVQRNVNLALFGSGVIVGVVDTGIDYQHPAFLYKDNTSRILSIWDQTIQDGAPPEGFTYGSEYSQQMINIALKSPDPLSVVPSNDENGHGTAIASIIAGSQSYEESAGGVVPQSELIVVKLKQAKQSLRKVVFVPDDAVCYQESDILLAIRYLLAAAEALKRPIAICIALGSSQTNHEGEDALSLYINYLVQIPKIGISISAGNEGNTRRHYFGAVETETFYKDFELKISSQDQLFSMEIWPSSLGRFTIEITSPTGESTQQIFPQFNECRKFDFVFESTVIWVNNYILEQETGEQLILIRFQLPIEGIWRFRISNIDNEPSTFHSWLPSGNIISNETFFLESNPDTTITAPGNAYNPITVTAYNSINNSILTTSSRGYTRSGQIVPDVAAPGFELRCAAPNNLYSTITGTGAAAALTTGIVAMVLEWAVIRGNYTNITGTNIKFLIVRGASRSSSLTYPNNIWGYGAIDIQRLFERLTV